jgi:hypothetical protein
MDEREPVADVLVLFKRRCLAIEPNTLSLCACFSFAQWMSIVMRHLLFRQDYGMLSDLELKPNRPLFRQVA